jgi:hypothetical protein
MKTIMVNIAIDTDDLNDLAKLEKLLQDALAGFENKRITYAVQDSLPGFFPQPVAKAKK